MLSKTFKTLSLALAIALAAPCAPSQAATGSASISVGTNVLSLCLVGGSTMAFGSYNASSQLDQTGTITVLCTFGTSYNVGLDAGTGAGATTTVRKMTGLSGGTLNYALYRNSAHSALWGSSIGTDTVAGTATGLLQSLTVYGRIPSGQAPKADVYSDTVTITLTY